MNYEDEGEQKPKVREYQRFGGPAFVWDVRGRDGERDSSDFNPTVEKMRRKAGDHINRPGHIKDGDTALVWSVMGPTRGPVLSHTASFHRQEEGLWSRFGYYVIWPRCGGIQKAVGTKSMEERACGWGWIGWLDGWWDGPLEEWALTIVRWY